jgi:hypothetical protein
MLSPDERVILASHSRSLDGLIVVKKRIKFGWRGFFLFFFSCPTFLVLLVRVSIAFEIPRIV